MQISKEFKFEMAHKLSKSYTCKCQHIHGHSYRVVITLYGSQLNDEMVVVDFTKVKEVVKPIIDLLDHSFMIHKEDRVCGELIDAARRGDFPLIIAKKNPTAEFIAGLFYGELHEHFYFNENRLLLEVEVFETATSSAKVSAVADKIITHSSTIKELEIIPSVDVKSFKEMK